MKLVNNLVELKACFSTKLKKNFRKEKNFVILPNQMMAKRTPIDTYFGFLKIGHRKGS